MSFANVFYFTLGPPAAASAEASPPVSPSASRVTSVSPSVSPSSSTSVSALTRVRVLQNIVDRMDRNHKDLRREFDQAIKDFSESSRVEQHGTSAAPPPPAAVLVSRVEAEQRQAAQDSDGGSRKRSRAPSPSASRAGAGKATQNKGGRPARPVLNGGDNVRNAMERQMRILQRMERQLGMQGQKGGQKGGPMESIGVLHFKGKPQSKKPPFFQGKGHRLVQSNLYQEPPQAPAGKSGASKSGAYKGQGGAHAGREQQQPKGKGPQESAASSSDWHHRGGEWTNTWNWRNQEEQSQGSTDTTSDWYGEKEKREIGREQNNNGKRIERVVWVCFPPARKQKMIPGTV